MNKLIKSLATVFGIGYIRFAQGTFASLAGLLLYLLIYTNTTIYYGATALILAVGFLVSGKAEALFKKKDARQIVIDDFAGVFIAYLFIPMRLQYIIIGFFVYRVMDALKLYPINRLERLPRGWGIMMDDIAAGIYANIVLQVLIKIIVC